MCHIAPRRAGPAERRGVPREFWVIFVKLPGLRADCLERLLLYTAL